MLAGLWVSGEVQALGILLYLRKHCYELIQARARLRAHVYELDAHALAPLTIAHPGTGANVPSRNFKYQFDTIPNGRRLRSRDK